MGTCRSRPPHWSVNCRAKGWRIVLIHRDPAEVVKSWLSLGAFTDDMPETHGDWFRSMGRHTPRVWCCGTPLARATQFYIDWNLIVRPYAHVLHRVDWSDCSWFLATCGIDAESQPWPLVDDGTPERHDVEWWTDETPSRVRIAVHASLGREFDYR